MNKLISIAAVALMTTHVATASASPKVPAIVHNVISVLPQPLESVTMKTTGPTLPSLPNLFKPLEQHAPTSKPHDVVQKALETLDQTTKRLCGKSVCTR